MERQVFRCPLCAAPYDEDLQSGTLQVRCKYCGGMIVVPSRLSGLYEHCPDHPDLQSVGLCSRCGKKCCEQCLHVLKRDMTTTLYLCPTCTKRQHQEQRIASYCVILVGTVMATLGLLAALTLPSMSGGFYSLSRLIMYGLMTALCGVAGLTMYSSAPTLQETRHPKASPDLDWAVCPICHAGYFYGATRIGLERTVVCQNCGRQFPLSE